MKVLVACEESQRVCQSFRDAGHEAWSCDLLPTRGEHPEWHLQQDALAAARAEAPTGGRWDLILAFPPCTHLSAAGARYWPAKRADGRQQAAVAFARAFMECAPRVCVENPVGYLSTAWRKPDQMIHPYMFGEPFTKKTCLWLKDVPPLRPTDAVEPQFAWCHTSQRSGPRKDGSRPRARLPTQQRQPNSARQRSQTFWCVARAMAAQWG